MLATEKVRDPTQHVHFFSKTETEKANLQRNPQAGTEMC